MKSSTLIIGLIFCVLLSSPLFSQSPVDDLIQTLEDLSTSRFDAWKYTTRITGDPSEVLRLSEPGYDDSSWETLMLNESIYVDSCWLRKEIELPPHLAGHTVEGPLSFLVSVDDYGYLWANGESLGHFPWNGEFVLTKNFLRKNGF